MPDMTKNITIVLNGKDIVLSNSNFLVAGGEAMLYKTGQRIIKIYHDPNKMRADDMVEKVKILSAFDLPSIVSPKGPVFNKQNNPIGFWMPFAEGEPLPRIFTSSFWLRNSFNFMQANHLVNKMRDVMQYAHLHQAVMVDPNEVNWLANLKGKNGPDPIAIDVDSWAVGKWKTNTLMLHIRDYHNADFTPLTDWFSWGVVTFQIYSGIHPYRGMLIGYTEHIDDIIQRMKDNKSVFTPGIKLNKAVRNFDEIPKPLLKWYQGIFERGERSMPPSPYEKDFTVAPQAAVVQRIVTTATGRLKFEKLLDHDIFRVFSCGIAQARTGELFDLNNKKCIGSEVEICEIAKVADGWLCGWLDSGKTKFSFIDESSYSRQEINYELNASQLFRVDNRLFVIQNNLLEVNFLNIGRPLVSTTQSVQLLQNVSWFDGIGIQEAIGCKFLILPFGDKSCVTARVKELDGQTVLSAKAGLQFTSLITIDKKGIYHKHEFTFNSNYSSYTAWEAPVAGPDLNLAILPARVCATILNDGELIIFVPSNGKLTKINDKQISTDKILSNWQNKVIYMDNGAVWQVSMT